jgi:hypothetical protein
MFDFSLMDSLRRLFNCVYLNVNRKNILVDKDINQQAH